MSYRYRFAYADKEKVDKMKGMSYDELLNYIKENNPSIYDEEEQYFDCWALFGQKEFFDFGGCSFYDEIEKTSIVLFEKEDTEEAFKECHFRLCDRTTFLAAIDGMRKLIYDYMIEMRNDENRAKLHFDEKIREWGMFSDYIDCSSMSEERRNKLNEMQLPYSLNLGTYEIVSSWRYEYAIFELVRFYKSFDWDKHYLIFYGW